MRTIADKANRAPRRKAGTVSLDLAMAPNE